VIFKSGKLLLAAALCFCFVNCSPKKETIEQKVVFVKIPPSRDEKLSREERFWQFQKFLFPQINVPQPAPPWIPQDDSLLWVKLEENGSLKINTEKQADLDALQKKLTEVFETRTRNGVFEGDNDRILKAVLIIAPDSARYGAVFDLAERVQKSGADPIVLQIGKLPTAEILPKP
jgi:biopolymer transport protein ExbD